MRFAYTVTLTPYTLLVVAAMCCLAGVARAETPAASASTASSADKSAASDGKPQQFLYVLRLVPRLHDDDAWSEADNAAVSRHFAHLKEATSSGRVILAGRTTESGDKTFGLVIFEAADATAARQFMESDPAVVAGVMTATLHPYAVALQRK